jgi:NadR type nicotinamide-nucleotide adenylyltransferase
MLLGKFLPPHLGHVYLCEFAGRYVDRLTVVVCSSAREPIPGALRYQWMRELFPFATVVHLTDELPQDPAENPDFWPLWKAALERVLPDRLDFVFASEDYGWKLAEVVGARFVPVDRLPSADRVSSRDIRADPMRHWERIPRCVRPYFVKRVCLFGPESTGKSGLAANLANEFQTTWVPEYARTLLEARGTPIELADMVPFVRGQIASEEALARNACRVLLCDTDPLTSLIWSETLFGTCDPWVREQADGRDYDRYLLLDVDVPWVEDPIRYLPENRRGFFDRCRHELEQRGRQFVHIRGTWDERFRQAREAVEQVLNQRG